jgi:hypothetical protein
MACRHYDRDRPVTCAAFPDRIPDLIFLGRDRHTAPVAGDHGIRFEPLERGAAVEDHRQ